MSMGGYGFLSVCGCIWVYIGVYGCLWVFMSMGLHRCLWVSMSTYRCFWVLAYLWVFIGVMGVYRGLWISGCLWVLMGGMSVYRYYIKTLKILPILSFRNPRRFENSKKRLKSHMCYKK